MDAPDLVPGAILVVSVHGRDAGVLSPIAGWQVVQFGPDGERLVGDVHLRRPQATAYACSRFDDIIGWRRLESTAWVAERRADTPARVTPVPRRIKGPHVPLWRLGATRRDRPERP